MVLKKCQVETVMVETGITIEIETATAKQNWQGKINSCHLLSEVARRWVGKSPPLALAIRGHKRDRSRSRDRRERRDSRGR